jgi:hypothetical protein
VIIAYHAVCTGEVRLSPELVDYRLYDLDKLKCWPAGTGYALADWLRTRGHEPEFVDWATVLSKVEPDEAEQGKKAG